MNWGDRLITASIRALSLGSDDVCSSADVLSRLLPASVRFALIADPRDGHIDEVTARAWTRGEIVALNPIAGIAMPATTPTDLSIEEEMISLSTGLPALWPPPYMP